MLAPHPPLESMMMLLGCGSSGAGVSFVGPLDAYTTDLKLMLLPFRGLSGYVGSCWRIRDDGDGDAEQAVLFDALGAPVFPTVVGNAAERWWYDQSGQGNDLGQATATKQPYLTDSILNGYPVARFDGTTDEMAGSDAITDNRTVYMVCKFRTGVNNARAWMDSDGGTNASIYYDSATGKFYYYATDGSVVDPVGGTATNWSLVCLKYTSGTTCAPWVNNTAATPFGTVGYADAAHRGYILGSASGANFGAVDIAARLTYAAAHDDTTRQAIQTILATQFGITLA